MRNYLIGWQIGSKAPTLVSIRLASSLQEEKSLGERDIRPVLMINAGSGPWL